MQIVHTTLKLNHKLDFPHQQSRNHLGLMMLNNKMMICNSDVGSYLIKAGWTISDVGDTIDLFMSSGIFVHGTQ